MRTMMMFGSFGSFVFLLLILWSYVESTPIVLMMEDNMYRTSDCIYIPLPGVRCEPDF